MEAIQTAITALEQELEVLQGRCGEINHAIGAMRKLLPAPNGKPPRTAKAKTSARDARNVRASRKLMDGITDQGMRIIQGLEDGGPQSPGALAKRLKFPNINGLRYHLKPLLKKRVIVAQGSTADRIIMLPGQTPPAKEAL
jgi:transposase